MTPAYPTSITFPFVTFSTSRKPTRNTSPSSRNPAGTASRTGSDVGGPPERRPSACAPAGRRAADTPDGTDTSRFGGPEERVRDGERQQHGEIEVQQAEGPARERRQEQHAEPDPDPRGVDRTAELAGDPACHRPVHLRPGPRLEDAPAAVVDDHLRDLLAARRRRRAAAERRTRPASGPHRSCTPASRRGDGRRVPRAPRAAGPRDASPRSPSGDSPAAARRRARVGPARAADSAAPRRPGSERRHAAQSANATADATADAASARRRREQRTSEDATRGRLASGTRRSQRFT